MNNREKLCAWLFEMSKKPYAFLFKRKKEAWQLSSNDLLNFPDGSLAQEVGKFLQTNRFELIDKLESHDVYHVITGMSTAVRDEIGMQYLLFGNGKRSLYLFATILIATPLLPEHWSHFKKCFKKGKYFDPIFKLDLQSELFNQLTLIRWKLVKDRQHNRLTAFKLLNDHQNY